MIQKRLFSGSETLVRQETAEGTVNRSLNRSHLKKPIDAFAGSPCVGVFFFAPCQFCSPAVMGHSHGVATS